MKTLKNTVLFLAAVFLYTPLFSQTTLTTVSSFGTNPGNLKMYTYVPAGISDSVSLVVALHGCTQTAASFAKETGWDKLADKHKFLMLYPEQQSANNSSFCFNWFDSTYQVKNQIEVLSIKQMVDYMKRNYQFDTTKIYITGLSAGACMTTVMLANYPDVFSKGAIMAGVPFKASNDTTSAFNAMGGSTIKTPGEWGTLVKNVNPGFSGSYPSVAVFHGNTDYVVNIKNASELIKQWTDLDNADQIPDNIDSVFQGDTAVTQTIYRDSINNKPVVCYYKIKGMGHGISVDTGSCPRQGGAVAAYALKTHFHSTYWAADFFDLIKQPYSISGAIKVSKNATNSVYSVPNTIGSVYTWYVPEGAVIASGQGSNSISVNFGTYSGTISVKEMTMDSCINDNVSANVSVLNYSVDVVQTAGVLCNHASTAALFANVTGGTSPYSYKWLPIGGTNATATGLIAGTYTLTVTDSISAVCKSTITVAEPPAISSTQTLTLCAGKSITIGSAVHAISGTFTDIIPSFNNCDSTVTTYLTVLPANTRDQTITKCFGESITVGSTTHSTTNTFIDVLAGFNGCDSIVTTHLTILPSITSSQVVTKCAGESVTVGAVIYDATGTFTDVLTSFQGCDSTVTTNLTITDVIDVSVNIASGLNAPILRANQPGANYQWINCANGNANILSATEQSYEASESGSYALVITENNCSDTSFCFDIVAGIPPIPLGMDESNFMSTINIYPNPFATFTTIEFSEEQVNAVIRLTNVLGTEIKTIRFSGKQLILEKGEMGAGVYFIQVVKEDKNVLNRKIVIE